jgi:myo-inositol-1-phosphate synthase
MARQKIGIWLVGARGGVATTATVGLVALKNGLVGDQALVSELPQFAEIGLKPWKDFVIGGHEIRDTSLLDEAQKLCRVSHAIDERLLARCRGELAKIDENIRPGTLVNVGRTISGLASDDLKERKETPAEAVARLRTDLRTFAESNKLTDVVVVNVSSTEPTIDHSGMPETWEELVPRLEKPRKCPLSASSLYAIAALDLGYPFINFTPSVGSTPAAIRDLAIQRKTCHMGRDGKTGETLLKSVLAPMFAKRRLEVMSWVGKNIFGNTDAVVLNDPENKKSKVDSKDRLLHEILGYSPQTLVGIDYIESLGDWKTAWDHIHFKGFLGTPMTFQFIWQGCDSLLAAPLVLDLVRFTQRAHELGETGVLTFLASFFKSPLDVDDQDFGRQFQTLEDWAAKARESAK